MAEYGDAVHIYLPHYGPLSGYGEEAGITGVKEVMVTKISGITRGSGGGGVGWR